MTGWENLRAELDHWQDAGSMATFWWRDDDADRPSAELDKLFDLHLRAGVPLCLAVVPAEIDPALALRCGELENLQFVQHGYAHRNHAAAGAKKTELIGGAGLDDRLSELANGLAELQRLFGTHLECVLVPPWNRIDKDLLPHLADVGFAGLSTHGPRSGIEAAPGLRQTNTHCDPVHWRQDRGFVGLNNALRQICEHLSARRRGAVDAAEPTGLLTHHLAMDSETWRFVEQFIDTISSHPAVRWLTCGSAMFGDDGKSNTAANR